MTEKIVLPPCAVCPTWQAQILEIETKIQQITLQITERTSIRDNLRITLRRLEEEWKIHMQDREKLLIRIRELEALLAARGNLPSDEEWRLRFALITERNEQIRLLLAEKENLINKFTLLVEMIEKFEAQWAICKGRGFICNNPEPVPPPPAPPVITYKWYYAVQDAQYRTMFMQHPYYKGGDVLIEGLEGATVVNPEYYTQSETVPGKNRLRVRVVDFKSMGGDAPAGSELFVRLKLGEATQFTQARPCQGFCVSWNQDMVFVDVPLAPHPRDVTANTSAKELTVEVVSRPIGSVQENVIGSASIDLTELVHLVTRVEEVKLGTAGILDLRIRALDFGMVPQGEYILRDYVHSWKAYAQGLEPAPERLGPDASGKGDIATSTTIATVERILAGAGDFPPAILQRLV